MPPTTATRFPGHYDLRVKESKKIVVSKRSILTLLTIPRNASLLQPMKIRVIKSRFKLEKTKAVRKVSNKDEAQEPRTGSMY